MKKTLILAALSLPLLASASTANLLTNGSFESGLTGWTITASPTTTIAPEVITYGAPGSAFGEIIPADDAASMSPDAVGGHGVYFVDDFTTQTLSQEITIGADGDYSFGFSLYVPANGFANPGDADFQATFSLFNTGTLAVSTLPATTWQHEGNPGPVFLTAGNYTAAFSFTTTGGFSKDVVVDRAYVTAAVPEPETYALMLAGLCAIGFMARRRRA